MFVSTLKGIVKRELPRKGYNATAKEKIKSDVKKGKLLKNM